MKRLLLVLFLISGLAMTGCFEPPDPTFYPEGGSYPVNLTPGVIIASPGASVVWKEDTCPTVDFSDPQNPVINGDVYIQPIPVEGNGASMTICAISFNNMGKTNLDDGIPATCGCETYSIVCPWNERGAFTLKDSNVALLDGITQINGDLIIGSQFTGAELPASMGCLMNVKGNLRVEGTANLTSLDGLSSLVGVGGYMTVRGNAKLASVNVPLLAAVGFTFLDMAGTPLEPYLDLVEMTGFDGIGGSGLWIDTNNPLLTSVNLPILGGSLTGGIQVVNQAKLASLDLGAVGGVAGYIKINDNPLLTSIDFDSLADVGGGASSPTTPPWAVEVVNNAVLANVEMGSICNAAGVIFATNPKLSDCIELDPIAAAVLAQDPYLPGLNPPATATGCVNQGVPNGGIFYGPSNGACFPYTGSMSCGNIEAGYYGSITIEDQDDIDTLYGKCKIPSSYILTVNLDEAALPAKKITSLAGLEAITEVGQLHITDSEELADLDGLSGLETINYDLEITGDNDVLTDISALGDITYVRDLIVTGSALADLNDLASLETIDRHLSVQGNAAMTDVGLDALCRVDDDFLVKNNPALCWEDVKPLLDEVTACTAYPGGAVNYWSGDKQCELHGDTWITDTASLVAIEGYRRVNGTLTVTTPLFNLDGRLAALKGVESLVIYNSDFLTDLDDFVGLETIDDDLSIQHSDSLTDLGGLANITQVDNLLVQDNDALAGLGDLSIVDIANSLNITANLALTALDMDALDTVGSSFAVTGNTALCTDLAYDLLGQLTGFSGTSSVSGNKTCP